MAEQHSQVQVLRLFGMETEAVTSVMRRAAAEGCPGLRLGQRDGEYVVCIQAKADTREEATRICEEWEKKLTASFGPAMFATGTTELPQAAVSSLTSGHKLIVAADRTTGMLLEQILKSVPAARAVFDFGAQTYQDEKQTARIEEVPGWAKKAGDPLTQAAGRAQQALRMTQADYALALVPALADRPAAVLLCTAKQGWMRAVPADASPRLVANWLLELSRRVADLLPMPLTVQTFRMGRPLPTPVLPTLPGTKAAAERQETPSAPEKPAEPAAPAAVQPKTEPAAVGVRPKTDEIPVSAPQKTQPAPAAPNSLRQPEAPARVQAPKVPEAPAQTPAPPRSTGPVRTLYGLDQPEELPIQPPKKKRRWPYVLLCILLVLLVAGGTAAAVWYFKSPEPQLDAAPAFRGYGTVDFDHAAITYLQDSQQKNQQIQAYLAFSGQPGALIYAPGSPEVRPGAVLADEAGIDLQLQVAQFSPQADLNAEHHNTLIYCPPEAMEGLPALDQLEHLQENCGFTLYQQDQAYRYKVAAVFYWDPAEQGPAAFDLTHLEDLTNYESFMEFVLGIKARSLFELPVDIQDSDRFVTLLSQANAAENTALVVVGRLQREGENARLERTAVAASEQPLYTARQYEAMGKTAPEMQELGEYWMNWYTTQGITASDNQEDQGMPQDDLDIQQLLNQIDKASAQAQAVANATPPPASKPTATPKPGSDASNSKPETTPAPAGPTPTPDESPAQSEDRNDGPQVDGGSTAPTVTLKVTMNGTRQEMEVVECLAMIAQNELGYNQPIEAYKAQAVAAHSWILTQGSYPAVSGVPPTQAVKDAVAQVANQVVTYNGSVAFTPYFASAAHGTCPSTEVWGTSRPYLVSVESPYDKDYATHWETKREYSRDEVKDRVAQELGVDLEAYSENPADWMGELQTNAGGYVTRMRVGDQYITGGKLRTVVLRDVPGRKNLRSSAFDVQYNADREMFEFTCWGYGHGCGMSQFGAVGYAANGASYADILQHYYPGTQLSPI